jgi:hypothetical protein
MIRREVQFLTHEVNVEQQGPTVATGPQSVKRASRKALRA